MQNINLSPSPQNLSSFSEQPQADNGSGEPLPGGITDADIDSNWDEAIDSFDGMEIPEELLRGIYAYGFEKPSAIQQRAIKPTMLGRDLIAQAQSGTVSENIVWCIVNYFMSKKNSMVMDGIVLICLARGGNDDYWKNTIFRVRIESPSSCR